MFPSPVKVRPSITIAAHLLPDAVFSTVSRVFLLLIVVAVVFAGFMAQLAIIEQEAFRLTLIATLVRLSAVVVVIVQVCASFYDDAGNGQLEQTLSLNLTRGQYLTGRALGGAGYALFLSLLAMIAVGGWSPWPQTAFWALGLYCELLVMALFALFVMVTLSNLAVALLVAAAFYLLSRFIEGFVLMASVASSSAAGINEILLGLSWLVPNFSRYNLSSWLVYGDVSLTQLGPVVGESLLVAALLLAAALVDFHRREL
ncbi:MAG: hypothetical protein VW985_09720 [Gammaproteobacteria bacterium]